MDPGVVLPADYTFTTGVSSDNGVHTFAAGVTLITPGDQTLTAVDTANGTIAGSATVTVSLPPAPPRGGNVNGPYNTPVQTGQQVLLLERLFASADRKESWLTLARLKGNASWGELSHGIGEVVA